jgi:hypothetical protein
MSLINFKPGNAAVTITKLWTDFKAVVAEKSLLMQYEEDSNLYYIYTLDGEIDYLCYIYKGSVPTGSSVYNQTQNDLDKTDWVNNYKSTAGQKQFDVLHNSTIKAASTAAVASDTALVVAISPNNTPPVKIDNGAAQGMLIPGAISVNYNIATNCQAKFTSGTKAYNSTYTACLISPGGGNVNWTYADGGTDTVTMIAGYPYCVKVSQINNSGTVVTDLQVFV